MRQVLLVDDEINVLHALQRTLRQAGLDDELRIEIYTEPEKALTRCREIAVDVVIADYRMPCMNGVEFLKAVKEVQPEAVRLMLSASTEFQTLMNVINQAEVFRFIPKPWHAPELLDTIRAAFEQRDQVLENLRLFNELRVQFGEMTPQELEARRLEADEPGITQVKWGEDGSVHLD